MDTDKSVEVPVEGTSEATCPFSNDEIKDLKRLLTNTSNEFWRGNDLTDIRKLKAEVENLKQKMSRWDDGEHIPEIPQAPFPAEFKISDIGKFDGTGDPELHVRKFLMMPGTRGLHDDQKAYAFPMSLTGNAERWYRSSNVKNTKKWDELQKEFKKHFSYKIHLDVTLRDLETTRQKPNETFSEFIVRWKQTAAKMIDRPNEKEQVNIIIKNLAPVYYNRMFCFPVMDFEQLHECGIKIEDAINKGELDQNEGKLQTKKECSSWFSTINNGPDAFSNKCQGRPFDDLHVPLSKAFELLCKKGYLKPLYPTPLPYSFPPPYSIPPCWNTNEFCAFHHSVGHNTDNCMWLRNEIQNLIDQNVIPKPLPPNHIARCYTSTN